MEKRLLRSASVLAIATMVIATASSAPVLASNVVTVNSAGGADFTTIVDAINSFGTGGANEANQSDTINNEINITGFGPYDEVLPTLDDSFGTDTLVINGLVGAGNRALVLIQNSGDTDGLNITMGDVELHNVIVAPSDTGGAIGDDLVELTNDANLLFQDSVMLALPPSSSVAYSTYTAEGDLPADLLAGSRAVDATLFRTGDNGFRTEGSSMLSVVDSVVTQQGPDNWVSVGTSGINFINSISSASANFGLQSSGEGPVTIQNSIITSNTIGVAMYAGSANIVDSTIIGNESVGVFSYNGLLTNTLDIVNCDIVNNGTWGIQVFRDNDPVPNITNSTIANNGHLADAVAWGYDGGNIEFLADTATTTTITYCTIASPAAPAQTSLRVGRPGDSGSSPISITDSIISSNGVGTHPLEIFETGNIRVLNSAIVTDLGGTIVGSYTDLGGVIHYDPAFVDAAANDFDVQNTSYAAAGTKGTTKGINDLRGDASYLGGVAPAAIDLTAADGSNINFGLTNKGVAPPNSVGVINTGGATAAVSTTITGTDAADFGVVGDPVVIPPGQTAYVEFTFDPSSAGVKNATGTIDGPSVTAPSGGADVNLTGEGTAVQDWMLLEN